MMIFDDQILGSDFDDQNHDPQPSQHGKSAEICKELRPLTLDGLRLCGRIPPGSGGPLRMKCWVKTFSGKKMIHHDFVTILNCIYGHDQLACTSLRCPFFILKQRMPAFLFKIVFSSISDKIRCISDRFRQTSPKSSVKRDVAVF